MSVASLPCRWVGSNSSQRSGFPFYVPSSPISLTTASADKEKIISSTQHPEGLEAIRQLEQRSPEVRPEEAATYQKPMFTQPLQSDNRLDEGQAVHLEARLIPVGDPKLKVDWFRNEQPLQFGESCPRGSAAVRTSYL